MLAAASSGTKLAPQSRHTSWTGRSSLSPFPGPRTSRSVSPTKVGFANINAKAEGTESKLAFRKAFEPRRCLVPVDNFCEWKKTATGKQPYAIALADRRIMALAGFAADKSIRSTSTVVILGQQAIARSRAQMARMDKKRAGAVQQAPLLRARKS